MKFIIRKTSLFILILSSFFMMGCTTITRSTVYSETVVMPVTPYYRTTVTTYSDMYPTRALTGRPCVAQYYYRKNLCPSTYIGYGYRTCAPEKFYCWN